MSHEPTETEQDVELSLAPPAVYANRFRIRVGAELTRLAFGESAGIGTPLHYRASILMPTADAMLMAATLRALADKLHDQLAAMALVGGPGDKLS